MKKFWIPIGLALCLSSPASADFTLYEADGNTLRMKGRLDARVVNTQDETEVVDGTSRLNFNFARDMGDDWEIIGTVETGVNLVGKTSIAFAGGDSFQTRRDDLLNLRLGFVGAKHPRWGQVTLGKQWGVYYDLAGKTDVTRTWGAAASGVYNFNGDGGLSGTGRAEKAIQYRNKWDNFSIALQTQQQKTDDDIDEFSLPSSPIGLTRIEYDATVGATLSYVFEEDHFIAVSYNEGEFTGTLEAGGNIVRDDEIIAIGYAYGKHTDGLYVAAMYADMEFHEADNLRRIIPESKGIEVYSSYRLNRRIMPYVLYNSLKARGGYGELYGGDEFHREFFGLGAVYFWDEQVSVYLDLRIDSSDLSASQQDTEDDGVAVGLRFTF